MIRDSEYRQSSKTCTRAFGAILAMSVPAAAFVFPGVMTARANLGMTKSSAHKTAADERAAAVRKERRQF